MINHWSLFTKWSSSIKRQRQLWVGHWYGSIKWHQAITALQFINKHQAINKESISIKYEECLIKAYAIHYLLHPIDANGSVWANFYGNPHSVSLLLSSLLSKTPSIQCHQFQFFLKKSIGFNFGRILILKEPFLKSFKNSPPCPYWDEYCLLLDGFRIP